jgi:hypothetical protein
MWRKEDCELSNSLIPFIFPSGGTELRTAVIDERPWFVGVDVCRGLDLKNPNQSLARLRPDEKGVRSTDTLRGKQDLIIVSEPGLYRLVFSSRKPSAERFQDWIYHEVLPALRRDGAYHMSARGLKFSLSPEGRALRAKGRANFLARPMWERQKRLAYLGNRRFGTYEAYCRALDTGEF